MFKVIIAGGRDFDDYDLLESACDYYFSQVPKEVEIEIVSANARGPQNVGETYANNRSYKFIVYEPNWQLWKNRAGPMRNKLMIDYSDALIAFWDEKSEGTKALIDLAKENKLKVRIVKY